MSRKSKINPEIIAVMGNIKESRNIKIYRPLETIIRKCIGFLLKYRFSDAKQVKKELLKADSRSQRIRMVYIRKRYR
ncbi:MAG: hypothetical protein K5921_06215 [Lachnospiraceae bacterium]|nr:hypothetical protein [Lachnospiraceae bacterium]